MFEGLRPHGSGTAARGRFKRVDIEVAFAGIRPALSRVERLLKPRLAWLMTPFCERLVGLCFVLAVIMSFPIPFGHMFPGLSIGLLALALLAVAIVWAVLFQAVRASLFFPARMQDG